jgi:hypothetical protein
MTSSWIRIVFAASGLYDGLLGAAFLLYGPAIYQAAAIPPPNHVAYVEFPALLLILFAVMFFRVAQDPLARRELMPYGMGLKASYAGVVLWHAAHHGMPMLWIPFAWTDLAFLILFYAAWQATK